MAPLFMSPIPETIDCEELVAKMDMTCTMVSVRFPPLHQRRCLPHNPHFNHPANRPHNRLEGQLGNRALSLLANQQPNLLANPFPGLAVGHLGNLVVTLPRYRLNNH